MTTPQALALADALLDGMSDEHWNQLNADAATMLRIQHEAIERKDALLRRMVDAWDGPERSLTDCYEVVEAIKQELAK